MPSGGSPGTEEFYTFSRWMSANGLNDPSGDDLHSGWDNLARWAFARDLGSLGDHAGYLSSNITFLLDAALGLINIEQNGIIKFFSVVAVVFMPPTLIASIYGMNFDILPELHWRTGYPMALGMMVVAAILPVLWFKRRGWL